MTTVVGWVIVVGAILAMLAFGFLMTYALGRWIVYVVMCRRTGRNPLPGLTLWRAMVAWWILDHWR